MMEKFQKDTHKEDQRKDRAVPLINPLTTIDKFSHRENTLRMTLDKFSRRNDGACCQSVAASMVNVHEHFSKSLVVLCYGCISPDHSLGKKASPKHCARPRSFSLRKKTIANKAGNWLEAS